MSRRQRMTPIDLAWLRMDRPTNLMMIVGGPVDLDRLEAQIAERLLRFRRFRQRIEQVGSGAYWCDDPNFDLSRHLHRVRLPGRGGKAALQRFVGELASTPLDFAHPLWQIHFVEKYDGGVAAVLRFHHTIGDGDALVRVSLTLGDDFQPAEMQEDHREGGWPQSLLAPLIATVQTGAKASGFTLKRAFELIREPSKAIGYLKTSAEVAGELAYLLLMPPDSDTRFKGQPHGAKRVAWSEPLKLEEVKAVAHAVDCSVNDILLSCVAGAMRSFLEDKGDDTDGVEVRAMVPINLRPPRPEIELGNHFGLLVLELPVGIKEPMPRLKEVRERMLALKNSVEPPVTLGLLAALGLSPKYVQDQVGDLISSKCTAVMTNVPGPHKMMTVAGHPLKQSFFWVPQSGDIGCGVSILTYAGSVYFGLITDAALVPDPEHVISRFKPEFEKYLYLCLLEPATAAAQ